MEDKPVEMPLKPFVTTALASDQFRSDLEKWLNSEVITLLNKLKLAEDALNRVVQGGDRDAYWSTDWHQTYEAARTALAELRKA